MSNIVIMTDSASDITLADEKRYGIDILPFQLELDGKSYTSRVDFDEEQFYTMLENSVELPKTSQITPYQFQGIYHRMAKAGVTDLILVLINSKGSQTFNNACMAVDEFFEEHPEYKGQIHIHPIDGIGYCSFYGEPVVEAAKMRENGSTADEIVSYLTEILPRRQVYFGIYTLKYAGKSGRIPSAAAFIGDKLNLKPVMKIADNAISTAAKSRGERGLVAKTATMSVDEMEPGTPYQVIYGSDPTCKDDMIRVMTEKVGYGPSNVYRVGAAVAANAGPKVCGVSFIKKNK